MTIDEKSDLGSRPLPRIAERLRQVARPYSARQFAEMTGHHPERVRRYLRGETPCVSFVLAVCDVMGLSADWLLYGRGPMLATARSRQYVLLDASLTELLDAVAWRWLRQPHPGGLAGLRAAIAALDPTDPSPSRPPQAGVRGSAADRRRHPPSNGRPPSGR